MLFSPNLLKQSNTNPDTLSKAFDAQSSGENHFNKNDKNNSSNRSGDSSNNHYKKTEKNRLNSLHSLDMDKSVTNFSPLSFDETFQRLNTNSNSQFGESVLNKTMFIDEIINDGEFDSEFFPTFSANNGHINSKDNEDMNNFYESSGSFDENESGNVKNSVISNNKNNKAKFSNDSDDSDSSDDDSDDSDAQKRIFVKINPVDRSNLLASPDVLNQVSKSLKLNLSLDTPKKKPNLNSNIEFSLEPSRSMSPLARPESTISDSLYGFDENNNEIDKNTKAKSTENTTTTTTTTTTNQTIFVSVFNESPQKYSSSSLAPPPLPPLPLVLKQKVQEQQKRYQQEFSVNDTKIKNNNANKEQVPKSEPILINTNSNGTIRIINKNLKISYDSSRACSEANKKVLRDSSNASSVGSNEIRLNIKIPADEDEMKF